MQSLAMLREQLKNGGVIRPVYENLEGLELGGADDYDYNCCHDYNDESTVVTKTTITTSASMMSDARRAGVNLNQKHSYANNHIKKKSSPPSAPPLPPPTSDSRSTNSNNNNTSPKAQWGKGFISSEERQRKELRDKQKNFAVELKEQNKRKIFQQKRVKQQRIIEHQRKVENEAARVEREGGGGVGVFDYNGSGGGVWGDGDGDGGLPIPPQYAFSSSNDLLKTQKPGGKAAFKSGLTMDEDSLMRSLARLDFRLEEKKIVLESKSVCSGAGGEGRSRGGKRVGGGGGGGEGGEKGARKTTFQPKQQQPFIQRQRNPQGSQPPPSLPSYQPPQFHPRPPIESKPKSKARADRKPLSNQSNLKIDASAEGNVYVGPGLDALITPQYVR